MGIQLEHLLSATSSFLQLVVAVSRLTVARLRVKLNFNAVQSASSSDIAQWNVG